MSKIKNYIPKSCVLAGVDILTVITENKSFLITVCFISIGFI